MTSIYSATICVPLLTMVHLVLYVVLVIFPAVSNHSKKGRPDSVISRSAVSTARHPTSYFLDGSLPSYALPTVAFQIRISLTTDNVSQDDVPTCHRYSKWFLYI